MLFRSPAGHKKGRIFLTTLLSGGASVLLFAFLSGNHKPADLVSYFVTFGVFFFLFRMVMIRAHDKKQQAMEQAYNDDDFTE